MSLTDHEIQTAVNAIEAKLRSPIRRQSAGSFSHLAQLAMLTSTSNSSTNATNSTTHSPPPELILPQTVTSAGPSRSDQGGERDSLKPPPKTGSGRAQSTQSPNALLSNGTGAQLHGRALTDTPMPSAPGSPHMCVTQHGFQLHD